MNYLDMNYQHERLRKIINEGKQAMKKIKENEKEMEERIKMSNEDKSVINDCIIM